MSKVDRKPSDEAMAVVRARSYEEAALALDDLIAAHVAEHHVGPRGYSRAGACIPEGLTLSTPGPSGGTGTPATCDLCAGSGRVWRQASHPEGESCPKCTLAPAKPEAVLGALDGQAALDEANNEIVRLKKWQDDVTVAYGSGYGGARFDEVAKGVRELRAENEPLKADLARHREWEPDVEAARMVLTQFHTSGNCSIGIGDSDGSFTRAILAAAMKGRPR